MDEISNCDDVIDSRNVIERIEELRAEDDRTEEEELELAALVKLAEQGDGIADWNYGATLIQDSYFTEYAQEYAEDVTGVRDARWPFTHIDWEAAARDLQTDYTPVEFDGVTYWVR